MKHALLLGTLISLGLLTSCTTKALWTATNPHEQIFISASDISESSLAEQHLKYKKYEDSLGKGYLVEKTDMRKLRDYTIRLLATPLTLTLDVPVTIIGVAADNPDALQLIWESLNKPITR